MRDIIKIPARKALVRLKKNRKKVREFKQRRPGGFVSLGVFINPTLIDVTFAFALILSLISEP
jgi:hypothetical protein